MTDVIKPTVAIAPPDRVADSQEMLKSKAASLNSDFRHLPQREVTSTADFYHLLQNQTSISKNATPAGEHSLPQGMPKLALHDPSLKIGRVILTGDSTPVANSQLTQFMRDHGFSEGGMAGYMKQTMLGAGSANADAVSHPDIQLADASGHTVPTLLVGEELLEVPPAATSMLQMASGASETETSLTRLNSASTAKPDSLPMLETKGSLPLAAEAQSPIRVEANVGETLAPTSTKDILSAQWPQSQDDQRQVAATQAGSRDAGATEVEFANQQQSGQRSAQGEQNTPFSQANPTNNEEAQTKAQQYREWSERFSELLGTRLAVAVREGSWSVQLDLDSMDLGTVAIQLHAGADGIEGQVTSSDPAVRQLLADSLPKLQAALEEALGYQLDQASVSLSIGSIESAARADFKTIALSAQELSDALPANFKAGDGLSVFV